MTASSHGHLRAILSMYEEDGRYPSDLFSLGVSLPHLRRPSGTYGVWDVERYCALPLALRAASVFFTFRAEVVNGGVDQFVFNQLSILPATIQAFLHIGAEGVAALLVELGDELMREKEWLSDSAVDGFLAFRRNTDFRGYEAYGDSHTVAEALAAYARVHPEAFIVETLETTNWSHSSAEFEGRILRRPDGAHEVSVRMLCERQWLEFARPPATFDLEGARQKLGEEMDARKVPRTSCTVEVKERSRGEDEPLWPRDPLPLDALPLGRALDLVFTHPNGDTLMTQGEFLRQDMCGDRAYGQVYSREGPDIPFPPVEPFWSVTCTARSA